jgi:type II secretory pathway component PulJ
MVSIMIFVVVSGAMLTILLTASNLYRRGEAGRSANDEAVAVLAALDADLSRAVPFSHRGILYAETRDSAGNTLLAFKTVARDPSTVSERGVGARSLVVWWVDDTNRLRRAETAEPTDDGDPTTDEDLAKMADMLAPINEPTWPVLTNGCMHFGAWLSLAAKPRVLPSDWTIDTSGAETFPEAGGARFYHGGTGTDPVPRSVMLTIGLTGGGRFAAKGFVISDNTTSIRIGGLGALPTIPGSMLRVEDEWIGYNGYNNGIISCPSVPGEPWVGRGLRRSTTVNHARQAPVHLAQTYSLVRDFAQ